MLKVDGLSKQLGDCRIENVAFEVARGDYFILLGESGAGKTVVLEMIAGLVRPDRGTILLDGRDITGTPIQTRSTGMVHQDLALFPHLSVRENIAYPLRARHENAATILQTVCQMASQVGAEALLDRRPPTLSLGEAQRVALARALATRPAILLLDEPLASLDAAARAAIRSLLRTLNAAGQTIVHVTHDYEEALALASHVAVLEAGRVAQQGPPREVFHHPRSEFLARFVGVRNFFAGEFRSRSEGGRQFACDGLTFHVAADAPEGQACLVFRSEDVTLYTDRPTGSVRNVFRGHVTDLEPVQRGVEVEVDVGVPVYSLVTAESVREMGLTRGAAVWIGVKSTALRAVPL